MNPTRLLRSFFRPAACLALGFVAALVATPGAHAALGVCDQGNLVDVEASGGTTPLAGYATLGAAFAAVNAGTHTGTINIEICGNTDEGHATATLNASGSGPASYTSIMIRPVGGAARTISGATTAGNPLINLNGADNVTIDGVNTGGDSLTISNTTASATAGTSTIKFVGGATNNTITNASILGAFSRLDSGVDGGTIWFSTDTVTLTGNDGNTVSNCDIGPAGANLPTRGIYSLGSTTTTANYNSGIAIINNNIYDFFGTGGFSAGVYFGGGSTDINVTRNRFYQTASRNLFGRHSAVHIVGANNSLVSGNTIGYASSAGTGTYSLVVAAGGTSEFSPIYLWGSSTTTASAQGNTIAGIAMSGAGSGTDWYAPFIGILIGGGGRHEVTGNTIGSMSATGSITYTSTSTSTSEIVGIYNDDVTDGTINNNLIGGITASNSNTGAAIIYGISSGVCCSVRTFTFTCENNVIGGTVADSIYSSASTEYGAGVFGMKVYVDLITGNTIRNLTVGSGGSVFGIYTLPIGSTTIRQNTIHTLRGAGPSAATDVIGIVVGADLVEGNFIHSFNAESKQATLIGISSGGTTTFANNMIRLGIDSSGAPITTGLQIWGIYESQGQGNFYFNSVYIGGTGVTGSNATYAFYSQETTATSAFIDNIFYNARSNGTGTGKHYIVQVGGTTPNRTGLTIDYNDYYADGAGAVFGYFNSLDVASLDAWRTAVGQDVHSLNRNPQFVNPTGSASTVDLHIHTSVATPIEGNGVAITDVAVDFDGQARADLTPTDIGADAGNFIGIDLTPPTITYATLGDSTNTTTRTLAITVTDASGVPTSGLGLPMLYFRKGATGAYIGTQCAYGTGSSYICTFTYSLLGGVGGGDTINYYVAAQDGAAAPNVTSNPYAGAAGLTANPPAAATPPATPSSFKIMPAISGARTVCSLGCDYLSLTNTAGVFDAINNSMLTDNTVVTITGDLTAETGAVALNQWVEEGVGNYTLTIIPSGARTVSGVRPYGALIALNGADRVTIDGLNNGGNSLTITNRSTVGPTAIALVSLGMGLGATNDTIRNCSISTRVATSAGWGISVGGSSPGTPGADNDFVTLQNNTITIATNGIYANGKASVSVRGLDNLTITGNTITTNTTLATYGIEVGNALNSTVSGNTVSVTTSASIQPVAISLGTGFVSSTVNGNKVVSSLATATGGYGGRGITVGTGTTTSALTISNNVVYGVTGSNNTSFANSSSMGIAIGVIGSSTTLTTVTGGVNLYYNSVNMAGTYSHAAACLTTALYIGSAVTALDLRDDVFVNSLFNTNASGSTSKNYSIYSAAANTAYTTINYNDYFVSGAQGVLGYLTSDRTDLAGIQAGFGQNPNSIAVDPVFASAANLQPQAGSTLVAAGTPVSVLTDMTGVIRSPTAPTIGAYEFPYAADLAVTQTDAFTTVATGSNVTYTITVTNNGPSAAASAVFADTLPPGAAFVSLTPAAGWTCNPPSGGSQTCTAASAMASGASAVFMLVVKVNYCIGSLPIPVTSITNAAAVTSTTPDPNAANNSSSVTTTVTDSGGCDDGLACTSGDHCSGTGVCIGTAKDCSDENVCTADSCVEPSGTCSYAPSGACDIVGTIHYYRTLDMNGDGTQDDPGEPSTKPVAGVDVTRVSSCEPTATATTNAGGVYTFTAEAGDITLTPSQIRLVATESECRAAITAADATEISKASVALVILTPNQRIAADVSNNGTITSYDAGLTAQKAVAASCIGYHFPVRKATGSDWAFRPVSKSFTPLAGGEDYSILGAMYGDVTGNWAPPVFFGAPAGDGSEVSEPVSAGPFRTPRQVRISEGAMLYLIGAPRQVGDGQWQYTLGLQNADGILGMDLTLRAVQGATIQTVSVAGIAAGFQLASNSVDGDTMISMFGIDPMVGSGQFLVVTVQTTSGSNGLPFEVSAEANEGLIPVGHAPGVPGTNAAGTPGVDMSQ